MIIETKNLSKSYTHKDGIVEAVKNANMKIDEGDFVTITGPSGSGKTTLLLLLAGLIKPTNGSIIFKDHKIHSATDNQLAKIRSENVGFVMQSFSLIPYLTALKNVMIPMSLNKNGDIPYEEYAIQLLETVGLKGRMNHLPKELSAGQQQRVAIARALANKPKLILADEPTGNLDPALSIDILKLLERFNKENGITVIMVTHSPSAAEFGNLRIHLKDGSIVN